MEDGRRTTKPADRPLLELRSITRAFGATLANDSVDLTLSRGEILGILGENGAGKSTLMNIVAGLLAPDEGKIVLDGETVSFSSPRAAADAGIGMVHQHFKLIGSLTVAENIALGDPRWGRGILNFEPLRHEIGELAAGLGMEVDLDRHIDDLNVGEQQRVEILKVLSRNPRLLILDEPTAVLTEDERPGLFRMIGALGARGTAIIIISHKLEDIIETCSRVVVLRGGRVVDDAPVAGRSRADLVRMIVGADLPFVTRDENRARQSTPLLTVEKLVAAGANGRSAVTDASFSLMSGEILGLCGVDGNGQSELVQVLTGMVRPVSGSVRYHLPGAPEGWMSAAQLRRLGLSHIPEDRHRHGLLLGLPLTANYLMSHLGLRAFNRSGWLRQRAIRDKVSAAIVDFEIKAWGPEAVVAQLSGGNQQKLVLAREMVGRPRIVIAAHPTRGLDVRTIEFVKRQLLNAREQGAGILLLSADLAEVWEIADRIMVMTAGRITAPVPVAQTTRQEVGHWMTAR